MKLLHIIYSGLGGHGAVLFGMLQGELFAEFDHEILFLGVEEPKKEYIDKCNELLIKYNYVKKGSSNIKFIKNCYKNIKKANADIVFTHTLAAVVPMILLNLFHTSKQKNILRDTQAHHLKSKKDWISFYLACIFFKKIIFLTKAAQVNALKNTLYFFWNKKLDIVNNGIDIKFFQANKLINYDLKFVPIIGMVSRLQSNKDHLTLIKAVSIIKNKFNIKNIQLDIAGDGSTLEDLKSYVSELNLISNVKFLGMLEEADLKKFFQNIQIYVHASHGETMSTSIMQAQSMALPLLASDVQGINNVINGVNGMLFKHQDSHDLAEKIVLLINDEIARSNLSRESRHFAEINYSHQSMINKYIYIFRNL